ncbi:MAG: hypothetical protein ABW007_27685 [Chitinophagaceae bacterium]
MSDSPVTMFIPFGEGYGNPGITLRADSAKELDGILKELSNPTDPKDAESVSLLDSVLDGVLTVQAGVTLKFPKKVTVAASAEPAVTHPQATGAADAPTCTHGSMKYKEGTSRSTGKQYKGWFCPAPQGAGQCAPQFVK